MDNPLCFVVPCVVRFYSGVVVLIVVVCCFLKKHHKTHELTWFSWFSWGLSRGRYRIYREFQF